MPGPVYIVQQYINLAGDTIWTLFSDGTVVPNPGGGNPGGDPGTIQFNDSGSFNGSDNFSWNNFSNLLTVDGQATAIQATSDLADSGIVDGVAAKFVGSIHNTSPTTVETLFGASFDALAGLDGIDTTIVQMSSIHTLLDAGVNAIVTGELSGIHISPGTNVPTVPPAAVYGIHIEDMSLLLGTVTRAIKVDGLAGSEFDGPGGFGPNNAVGQIGPIGYGSGNTTGAPRSRSLLDVEGSYTTPESAHFTTAAIVAGIDANAAADDTDTSWYGVFATSQSHVSNTHHMSELIGGLFQAEHYATGIMDEVNGIFVQTFCPTGSGAVGFNIGIDVSTQPSSASTTTTGIGIRVKTGQYNASGTVANNYGIQVQSPNTTGHLTHNYGIRIEDQSLGGANNPDPWSLYVVGGTTFLGGPLQLSTITKMNGETTAGAGASYIRGVTLQKGEVGADANVLTVTPITFNGLYRIAIVISVSAASAATIGWTATWRDSNATAQAPTNLALTQAGVAAPALTFTAAAGATYFAEQIIDVNNAGTNIVIKTTFAGTSIAYKVSATIERLA